MNSVNCTDILRNACPLRNAYLLTAMWRNTGQGSCSYENDVNTSANNVGYVHKFLFVTWRNCSDEIHFQARNQLFYWGWSRPSSFLPFSLLSSPLLSLFPSFSCPTPKIQLEGSGERCISSPSGSGQSPAAKRILVQLKVTISQITLINWHVHNTCQ